MRIGFCLMLAAELCASGGGLEGQATLRVGAGGGAIFNSTDVGWNMVGLVTYSPAYWPVGFRVDVLYGSINSTNRFLGLPGTNSTVKTTISAGMLDLVYQARGAGSYLLAGAGVTHVSGSTTIFGVEGNGSSTDFAAQLGAGFTGRLSRTARIFVEGRFIRSFYSDGHTDFVPLTLGLMFDLHS